MEAEIKITSPKLFLNLTLLEVFNFYCDTIKTFLNNVEI